jgi:hypothetical protein
MVRLLVALEILYYHSFQYFVIERLTNPLVHKGRHLTRQEKEKHREGEKEKEEEEDKTREGKTQKSEEPLAKTKKEVWLMAIHFFGYTNFWLVKLAKISLANGTFPKLGLR